MTDIGRIGENDLLDFDNLFSDFAPRDDDDLYFFDAKTPNSYPSHNSTVAAAFSIGDIESLLLDDDFEPLPAQKDTDVDAFLSELFVDSPPALSLDPRSDSSASVSPSHPTADCNSSSRDCSPSNSDQNDHHPHPPEENTNHVQSDDAVVGIDPDAKKRKRQLMNRDAAVRSRERKKMYVRDLEMKSRYYEAESRRLEWMLQCLRAENHALQIALHTNRQPFGASAKQESAVLLLESLLLGSLLWLMGIIGLFILPRLLLVILEAALLGNAEEKNQTSLVAPKRVVSDVFGMPVLHFMKNKRWRGSRTRMKACPVSSCKCLMSFISPFSLL